MRSIFFSACLILICTNSFPQDISGNWKGDIDINGQQIPIVFHFKKDSSGNITGKWDSPKQNAVGLPFSEIQLHEDSVHLGIKMIGGSYEGKFIGNDSIAGIWHQGGGQLNLNFSRASDAAFEPPKRPQTPKPPFNYLSEDVMYSNADNSINYGATFTRPDSISNKKYTAVILITGSGKQDRNENIFDHEPFFVIADYLTKRGIAVLRVDDRGIGKTTGDFDTSSSADFANDVEAGIKYLKSRNDVDIKHIGLIGHSEGGMIAPMIAAKDKQVSFIVMLAGTGVAGSVINDYQNTHPMKVAGMSDTVIQKFLDLHHALVKAASSIADDDEYKKAVSKIYYDWKKNQSAETLNKLIKGTDEQAISILQQNYRLFHSKWWRFFLVHDPAKDIEKLSIPALVLNGSKDIQVDPKINLPAIESALKKSKSKNYKIVELPGLNHLFQHCIKCTFDEYGQIEETFAPEALKAMGDWIEDVAKK